MAATQEKPEASRTKKNTAVAADSAEAKAGLLAGIIDASIDSLVALDRKFNIVSWNEMTSMWTGFSRTETMGRLFFDVFPNAEQTPGLGQALADALDGKRSFLPSRPGFFLDGYFETHIVPLREAGKITGVLQIIHDVAHRVKAENELKELNDKLHIQNAALRHAQEEMGTFAKVAAHDLKEPLRKIYTFAELIRVHESRHMSEKGRGYFRSIQKSVQRMGLLTDDIVNFLSLNNSGKTTETVSLTEVLLDVFRSHQSEIHENDISVDYDDLPVIQGNSEAVHQIFFQIVENALKFRDPLKQTEITVSYHTLGPDEIIYHEAPRDMQYHCIAFRDNGIGFDPQCSEKVFGMFQKLHPQHAYRGSGMGLAIALKAARMLQGFIKVKSQPGEGSVFYCYLPKD